MANISTNLECVTSRPTPPPHALVQKTSQIRDIQNSLPQVGVREEEEEEEFFNHYKNDLKRHAHTPSGVAGADLKS